MQSHPLYWLFLLLHGRSWLPRRLQIAARRRICRRVRTKVGKAWPISERCGRRPDGWPGWPQGKQFALVLTHDVDTQRGLDRCRLLMQVEEQRGLRSAYYLVPRGRYPEPTDLIAELKGRGFEVGVHGLYHDWWTFHLRWVFERRAPLIRHYLRQWGALGFRAPSMIRKMGWICELGSVYDASSFDADPFEPQPDGVGTIFPYRIERPGSSPDLFELPYTLPQDFTLFVLLQEETSDIWKRKLDWIAANGGMALIDSHPDYMRFDDGKKSCDEYSSKRYEEILDYVASKHKDRYWHALPQDVVRYCNELPKTVALRAPKRICMLAYAFYESDNRIRRYAETLASRGDQVDIIALRRDGQSSQETLHGVNVLRIQHRRRDERGPLSYLGRLLRFLMLSARTVNRLHAQAPYDVIHVHSVPDFEVFAAWLPKRNGARIILDIHDLVPDFYASKFKVKPTSIIYKLLVLAERLSTGFADHVIISNHIWYETLTKRSVPRKKCSVVLNYPDQRVFHPCHRTRADNTFIMIYPGGLQWHQGVDLAIRAFAKVRAEVNNFEFHIYGEGSEKERLRELVGELGLENCVLLKPAVPIAEIPQIMANADLGVVAKRSDSFGNEAYSTKILEFMSQGVPVLVAKTKIDTQYFDDSVVQFFEPNCHEKLAEAMLALIKNPLRRDQLRKQAFAYLQTHNWEVNRQEYLDLVDGTNLDAAAATGECDTSPGPTQQGGVQIAGSY